MFTDSGGQIRVSILHAGLIKATMAAVREEGLENRLVIKVCNAFRGRCTEKTVKYLLRYLEEESRVYSDVDKKRRSVYYVV